MEKGTYSDSNRVIIHGRRGGFAYVTFEDGPNVGKTSKVPDSWVEPDALPTVFAYISKDTAEGPMFYGINSNSWYYSPQLGSAFVSSGAALEYIGDHHYLAGCRVKEFVGQWFDV